VSSAPTYGKIHLAVAGLLLVGLARATPQIYTDQATYIAALPGASTTLDFDSATADSLIPSASALDGITFGYALDGVQLKVSTSGGGYSTTSGAQFLGSDDAHILQDGDALTLSFAAVNAIGLYVISNDVLEDNDISLTAGGTTASLSKTATQGTPLGDGSVVYFLGIIDDEISFATASLNTAGNSEFLFNVDDIITVAAPDDDGDGIPNVEDNCTQVANGLNDTATAGISQNNSDGDNYGNVCDADLDGSLSVNFSDLVLLKARFNTADPDADFNGDGAVNFSDVVILKALFNQPPGPSGLAP
jgi:hypothetical protein